MKRMRKRKYSKSELQELMIRNDFSYDKAGIELGQSRQSIYFLCYYGNLVKFVQRGQKELRKRREDMVKQVFEDCYFCKTKTAKALGMSHSQLDRILHAVGLYCKRRTMEECKPIGLTGNLTTMAKEAKLLHNFKKEIERQIDVPISMAEFLVAICDFSKGSTQIIAHLILKNRKQLWENRTNRRKK